MIGRWLAAVVRWWRGTAAYPPCPPSPNREGGDGDGGGEEGSICREGEEGSGGGMVEEAWRARLERLREDLEALAERLGEGETLSKAEAPEVVRPGASRQLVGHRMRAENESRIWEGVL